MIRESDSSSDHLRTPTFSFYSTNVRYVRYKLLTKFTTFYFTKLGRSSYEFQYFAAVHFHNNSIRLVKLFGDGILGPKTRYMPN